MDRISRFFLNQSGDRIEDMEIIEANNPILNVPTTGVIVGNEFYYIANCALRAFNQDGSLNRDKLKDVVILKAVLLN